jgi:hypothetical protein
MNAQARSPQVQTATRKPWKKKTPVEIVLGEEAKLKEEVTEMEASLAAKKRQLQKFAEARKIFETT